MAGHNTVNVVILVRVEYPEPVKYQTRIANGVAALVKSESTPPAWSVINSVEEVW